MESTLISTAVVYCLVLQHVFPYVKLQRTYSVGVAEGVATLEYRNTRSGYLLTYVPKYIYQVSR